MRLHEDEDVIWKLVSEYPSHGFVIDRSEAEEFIDTVREINEAERTFEKAVGALFRTQIEKATIVEAFPLIKNEPKPKPESKRPSESRAPIPVGPEQATDRPVKSGHGDEAPSTNGDGERQAQATAGLQSRTPKS